MPRHKCTRLFFLKTRLRCEAAGRNRWTDLDFADDLAELPFLCSQRDACHKLLFAMMIPRASPGRYRSDLSAAVRSRSHACALSGAGRGRRAHAKTLMAPCSRMSLICKRLLQSGGQRTGIMRWEDAYNPERPAGRQKPGRNRETMKGDCFNQ